MKPPYFISLFAIIAILSVGLHYLFYLETSGTQYLASETTIHGLRSINLEAAIAEHLAIQRDNSEKWMSFMTILSTLFAVFFVYTGFKIESAKEQVDAAAIALRQTEAKLDDIQEFAMQLQYAMSYIMSRQYSKAIDTLSVLRNEPFVVKYSNRINTCHYFLANCYYELAQESNSLDDYANAVDNIYEAIDDEQNPLRQEIINAYTKRKSYE